MWRSERQTQTYITAIEAADGGVQCCIAPPIAYVGDRAVGAAVILGASATNAAREGYNNRDESAPTPSSFSYCAGPGDRDRVPF